MIWRIAWFFAATIVISYACYILVTSAIHARASGTEDPVVVRDVLERGVHHLSGMVTVPSPCDQLSVKTVALSTSTYMLDFTTWREPSIPCTGIETPRSFRTLLFTPHTGVQVGATLDGAGLPIVIIPIKNSISPTTTAL